VQALSIVQVENGEPVSSYLNGARHLGISAVLVLVAGVVIAAIGAGEWLRHRQRVAAT
jgi:hypothetical protein